tara:strand:- start:7666 stop:8025 length:360 start_codon:yes stop_codon:yes gene_type:complete
MSDPFTPQYELEKYTLNPFNIMDFRRFLVENRVIVATVSFTVAHFLNELIKSLMDNLLFVKVSPEEEMNNVKNESIFDKIIYIYNYKFKVGIFALSLIKFVVSFILIFYISRIINDSIN